MIKAIGLSIFIYSLMLAIFFIIRNRKKDLNIKTSALIGYILKCMAFGLNTFLILPLLSLFLTFEIGMSSEFYSDGMLSVIFNIVLFEYIVVIIPYIISLLILFFKDRKYFKSILILTCSFNFIQCCIFGFETIQLLSKYLKI